jgi:hypothetical protein
VPTANIVGKYLPRLRQNLGQSSNRRGFADVFSENDMWDPKSIVIHRAVPSPSLLCRKLAIRRNLENIINIVLEVSSSEIIVGRCFPPRTIFTMMRNFGFEVAKWDNTIKLSIENFRFIERQCSDTIRFESLKSKKPLAM